MIKFNPESLRDDIVTILEKFDFLEGEIEGVTFNEIMDKDCYEDYDVDITEETKICLFIGADDSPYVSFEFLKNIFNKWENSKINEAQSYAKNTDEIYFLLNTEDYDSFMFLETLKTSGNSVVKTTEPGVSIWEKQINIDNKNYMVSLYNGICLYHLKVEESGNYDKYLPSYSQGDYFIKVVCDDVLDIQVADSLASSFMFEIYSTHNLRLEFSNGRPDPEFFDYDELDLSEKPLEIFPLIYGRGMKEIIEIYNKAKTTYDEDYKILSFTKVIEYIAPTVANEKLYEAVRLKLTSPDVFSPTSKFINELGEIYKKYQNDICKDLELLKLAIFTVLYFDEIHSKFPVYLQRKNFSDIKNIDENTQQEYMEILAEAIYDTRNEIAHAKANYKKKGKECPQKQKNEFVEMLDYIAVKCIRWFSMQPEEKRVIV